MLHVYIVSSAIVDISAINLWNVLLNLHLFDLFMKLDNVLLRFLVTGVALPIFLLHSLELPKALEFLMNQKPTILSLFG